MIVMNLQVLLLAAIIVLSCQGVGGRETITVAVLDVMNMSKDEFIANGLGSGSAYSAQRVAIAEGSSHLLTSVLNAKPATSPFSASSAQSAWRRSGQFIGGGSEAEEEEFFAEADRVFDRWLEVEQVRKIQEATEKRKQAESERKGQKNGDQQASAEASSDGSPTKNNKDGKSGANNDDANKQPLALPATTIASQDVKRRKSLFSLNTTIEQKIKNVAFDIKAVMRRLRAAFLPSAKSQSKVITTGKSAANAARHRRFLFDQYYHGALPASLINDPVTGLPTENETIFEAAVESVIYDMLRTYTSSSSPSTAGAEADNNGILSSITSAVSPFAWYPRLHSLPIVDGEELSLLAEELRNLKAAELALESQFSLIEKGSYQADLDLKIASLKKGDKDKSEKKSQKEKGKLATIESNPREYYRSLRQLIFDPKIGEELKALSNIINTNYQYQSQLIHSSFPIISILLPRLRAEMSSLKSQMRSNDESTTALRKQLKEQNQILKIMSNDVTTLDGISMRMNRFRLNGYIGLSSSVSSRSLLLSAADVTTLLMWITEERRSGSASSATLHKDDFARIERGEQPVGDTLAASNDGDDSAESASDSNKKRKDKRKRRSGGHSASLSDGEGDGSEFVKRPLTEWTHVVTFTAVGLSFFELLNLVLAITVLPLLDSLIQTPLMLVKYTRWVSFQFYPRFVRWACPNRTAGPTAFGQFLVLFCRLHVVFMSILTVSVVKFGVYVAPIVGLYSAEFIEKYVVAYLMFARQLLTYNSSSPFSTLNEIQLSLRQHIPFAVWVLATPPQQIALTIVLIIVAGGIISLFTLPMYRKASRDLAKMEKKMH